MSDSNIYLQGLFNKMDLINDKGLNIDSALIDTGAGVTMLTRRACRNIIAKELNVIYELPKVVNIPLKGMADVYNTHCAILYYMQNVKLGNIKFDRFYFFVANTDTNENLIGMDIIGRGDLFISKNSNELKHLSNFNMQEYLEYYDNLSGYDSIIFPQLAVFIE